MASLTLLKKPLIDSRGPVGQILKGIVYGAGGGTAANIFDKKLTQGKISAAGIQLGKTLNGKPLTLNGTDVVALAITNGIKMPTRGSAIAMAVTLGIKKYFEAYDYIDPYEPMDQNDKNATNVTRANHRGKQPQFQSFRGNYV